MFCFYNGGAEYLYLSNADWMERKFFRRMEICFPVLHSRLKRRVIREGLRPYLARDADAWEMDSTGQYRHHRGRRGRRGHPQIVLLEILAAGNGG